MLVPVVRSASASPLRNRLLILHRAATDRHPMAGVLQCAFRERNITFGSKRRRGQCPESQVCNRRFALDLRRCAKMEDVAGTENVMEVRQLASLTLSDEVRAELKSLTTRRKTALVLALRARIVLTCAEGGRPSWALTGRR